MTESEKPSAAVAVGSGARNGAIGARRLFPTPSTAPSGLSVRHLEVLGRELGFVRCAAMGASAFPGAQGALERWLARGHGADMDYLRGERASPERLLPGANTVIVVALPHASATSPNEGPLASYALGPDYHHVLKDKLWRLAQGLTDALGTSLSARVAVDTAPLLEREAATRSGMGFVGKNTMHIIPGVGSFVLLGELLLDVDIAHFRQQKPAPGANPIEQAAKPRHVPVAEEVDVRSLSQIGCGDCTACLDACPTQAFSAPYDLDARRCISYLTIERQAAIPTSLRSLVGTWAFGCDVCQNVCPYNHSKKRPPADPALEPAAPDTRPLFEQLVALLQMTSGDYRRFTRGRAARRASRSQLQRNAAVALGNLRDLRAVPPLIQALQTNRSAAVRAHAAWALGQYDDPLATGALMRANGDTDTGRDPEGSVRREAAASLKAMQTA